MTSVTVARSSTLLSRLRLACSAVGGIEHGDLLQGGVQLLLATGAVHALNYLYHVVMSRALGPADYGALVVLLSIVLVLTVPMNTLQTTIALQTAAYGTDQGDAIAAAVIREVRGPWLAVGFVAWIMVCLASPALAAALRLPSASSIIVTGALLPIAPLLPVIRGAPGIICLPQTRFYPAD